MTELMHCKFCLGFQSVVFFFFLPSNRWISFHIFFVSLHFWHQMLDLVAQLPTAQGHHTIWVWADVLESRERGLVAVFRNFSWLWKKFCYKKKKKKKRQGSSFSFIMHRVWIKSYCFGDEVSLKVQIGSSRELLLYKCSITRCWMLNLQQQK